jgi:hypothetical protein
MMMDDLSWLTAASTLKPKGECKLHKIKMDSRTSELICSRSTLRPQFLYNYRESTAELRMANLSLESSPARKYLVTSSSSAVAGVSCLMEAY